MRKFAKFIEEKELNSIYEYFVNESRLYKEQYNLFCEALSLLNEADPVQYTQNNPQGNRGSLAMYTKPVEDAMKGLAGTALNNLFRFIGADSTIQPVTQKQLQDQLQKFYGKLKDGVTVWNQFKQVVNRAVPKSTQVTSAAQQTTPTQPTNSINTASMSQPVQNVGQPLG